MAKLYFMYGAMWAWKSMELIKVAYNYLERWKKCLIFNSLLDTRFENWKVSSRTWGSLPSIWFDSNTNIEEIIKEKLDKWAIDCILIDEAQFLNSAQVEQCAGISTKYNIPVICYGIKTDFMSRLFEWSKRLLELAEQIEEIKTICWCGKKATMNARIIDWKVTLEWEQIDIWANEKYISLCLKHYQEKNIWN